VRVKLVIAGGLAITAVGVIVMLFHSPATVAATNGVPRTTIIGETEVPTGACQGEETLPAGTSAIRFGLAVTIGPQVAVKVLSGSDVVAQGVHGTGWDGEAVTIPVTPTKRTYSNVIVCFQLSRLTGYVSMLGTPTSPPLAATDGYQALSGRMRIEYLRPGTASWWSLAGTVIQHMGLGRAAAGTWIVLPIAALASAVIALASWMAARELQ
jgi:hypothetical protein